MSSFNKTTREKKLAGIITGLVSLTFLTSAFFIKIVVPVRNMINEPITESPIEMALSTEENKYPVVAESDRSLSSSLPAGISYSIVKIETELLKNSFVSSVSSPSKSSGEVVSDMPQKAPDQSMGESSANAAESSQSSAIGGNLKNRKLLFIEKVNSTNNEGIVVVRTSVNQNGEVISAEVDPYRTTTSNTTLRSKACKTALTALFESLPGNEVQSGFITFKFEF